MAENKRLPEAYLLTTFTHEQVVFLLPRGINVVSSERHGGALRVWITGKELTDGAGYQLVSTEGPLLRCIELVENDVEEDPFQAAEPQERKKPVVVNG